ncbi:kelch-like protein 8 [Dendronephthya gigantea]|uniref:kelch-like protein 8 n=1 Tax=Dendronephthya gigantea TaxID=151771 RepID=UPI00106CAEE6|nr:kelch-like protein 8 [Dendronephthya gigantea]
MAAICSEDSYEFVAPNICTDAFNKMEDLFSSGELFDVTLIVGEKKIKAHRIVLASVSPYFKAMFTNRMSESSQDVITIKDVEEDVFLLLIRFIYSHRIMICVDNVQSLLQCANILQIDSVVNACCDFIYSHLSISNCLSVRDFVDFNGCVKLVRKVDAFIKLHFLEVTKSEEFLDVTVDHLKQLLSGSNLNVPKEEDVFESVMRWINHSSSKRQHHLGLLMPYVRLPMLPVSYLITVVEKETFVSKNLVCRDLIDEAKNFHLCPEKVSLSARIFPRKSYSGMLFSIGGRGKGGDPFSKIEIYNWLENCWTPGPRLLMPRRHVAAGVIDGVIYAVGGHNGSEHLNTVESFHPASGSWQLCKPMGICRRGMSVGILNDMLYAIGGLDENTCFNRVERYDPKNDEWTEVAAMTIQRGGVAAVGFNGFLYAVGGNNGGSSLSSVEKYDPHRNIWVDVTSMNQERAGLGVAVLGGYLYAIGGFDDSLPLQSAERYNPHTNTWSVVSNMNCYRGGVGVCTMGRMIWAVGGHDGASYLNTVEYYDIQTDSWQLVSSMEVGRAGAGVVSCKCNIEKFGKTYALVETDMV